MTVPSSTTDSAAAATPPVRVLLTGASGFIGSHLLRHLHGAGYEVHVLQRRPLEARLLPFVSATYPYAGHTADVVAAMESCRPEIVCHLASLFLAAHVPEQVQPLIEANVLLGTQLLEGIALQKGPAVFLNAATSWQYFHSETYRPANLYAATKEAFQAILAFYADSKQIRCATLHLFDSYGPADPRKKLFALLRQALQTGEPLAMSPGEQMIDLAHVDDIARAFLHVARQLRNGRLASPSQFAVSGGQRRTLREVVAAFERAAGRSLRVEWGAREYREREVMRLWNGPDIPGWSPQITLEDGFRDLLRSAE